MSRRVLIAALSIAALSASLGCEALYPEVLVVNELGDAVLVRQVSFSGCVWAQVLADGESTSPGRCLPGEDRVHFERLDAASHCAEQVADGTIPGACPCDGGPGPDEPVDPGLVNETPLWFNYQTVTTHEAGAGDLLVVTLKADDLEQDFSEPGPYGH